MKKANTPRSSGLRCSVECLISEGEEHIPLQRSRSDWDYSGEIPGRWFFHQIPQGQKRSMCCWSQRTLPRSCSASLLNFHFFIKAVECDLIRNMLPVQCACADTFVGSSRHQTIHAQVSVDSVTGTGSEYSAGCLSRGASIMCGRRLGG